MRRALSLFTIFLFVVCAEDVSAALVINVGSHTLAPNQAGQAIDLFVTATDPSNDPSDIAGLNLNAFLGDGTGSNPEPIFAGGPTTNVADGGVVLTDGSGGRPYIWDAGAGNVTDADVGGNEQFQSTSFTFNSSSSDLQPDGLLGTLYVDTTGFASGTYALVLSGGGGVGLPSTNFIQAGGAEIVPNITDGSITIEATAVPEPSSLAVLGALAAGGAGLRRLRRRKQAPVAG